MSEAPKPKFDPVKLEQLSVAQCSKLMTKASGMAKPPSWSQNAWIRNT